WGGAGRPPPAGWRRPCPPSRSPSGPTSPSRWRPGCWSTTPSAACRWWPARSWAAYSPSPTCLGGCRGLPGGGEPSSRITLVLPDVPGALGRAMTVVGELGVNLLTVVTEPGPEPGTRGVVLRAGTINAATVVAALVAAGLPATGPRPP